MAEKVVFELSSSVIKKGDVADVVAPLDNSFKGQSEHDNDSSSEGLSKTETVQEDIDSMHEPEAEVVMKNGRTDERYVKKLHAEETNINIEDEESAAQTLSENSKRLSPDRGENPSVKTINEGIYEKKPVIKTKNIPPRGILKATASEPSIIVTPPPKPPQHSASSEDFRSKRSRRKHPKYLQDSQYIPRMNQIQSVQEFVNPAFELDENVPNDFRLADIVEQVLQQEVQKYQHPFGKGNLYNTVFLGEKSSVHADGGKFILWFIFAFALVGMAGVIIFMSEIYKSDTGSEWNKTLS